MNFRQRSQEMIKKSNQFPSLTMKYCDQSKLISCLIMKIRELPSKYSVSSIFLETLIFSCYLVVFIGQLLSNDMKTIRKFAKTGPN